MTYMYLIENCYNDSNKVYIGKTKTSRKNAHKYKFGKNIIYTIIDQIDSYNYKDWEPLESYWIEQFRQWGFELMNKNRGGGGVNNHSETTRDKMKNNNQKSEEYKEKLRKPKGPHSEETKQRMRKPKKEGTGYKLMLANSKPVLQYDLEGNFIKEWENRIVAAKSLGKTSQGAISECCSGKRKSIYGYIWKNKN